jgi:hypothetical protein
MGKIKGIWEFFCQGQVVVEVRKTREAHINIFGILGNCLAGLPNFGPLSDKNGNYLVNEVKKKKSRFSRFSESAVKMREKYF